MGKRHQGSGPSIVNVMLTVFIVGAVMVRIIPWFRGTEMSTLSYLLPLAFILLFVVMALTSRSPYVKAPKVPPLPGSMSGEEETLEQYLKQLRALLAEQVAPLRVGNDRLEAEVGRLNTVIQQMDREERQSQIWSIILGIVGGWLASGVPLPFHF